MTVAFFFSATAYIISAITDYSLIFQQKHYFISITTFGFLGSLVIMRILDLVF